MTTLANTKKHDVSLVTITPDMARHWLLSRPYKGQRQLRAAHVKFLAEEMERKNFRPSAEIVFAVEEDRHFLVNGQHTLNAIVQCGIPQTLIVFCYQSGGEEDTAEIYGVIDTNLKRTANDLFSAMYLSDELAFTATNLNRVSAAAKLIGNKFLPRSSNNKEHPDDLVRRIREYAPAAHLFFDAVAELPGEMQSIFRASSLSIALVTFRFSAQLFGGEKVRDFWRGVAFDDGIVTGDARKVAHRHILTSSSTGSGPSTRKTNMVSPYYSARFMARCFNAYVEGEKLFQGKILDATSPIKIVGSPFTGKE